MSIAFRQMLSVSRQLYVPSPGHLEADLRQLLIRAVFNFRQLCTVHGYNEQDHTCGEIERI